MGHGLTILKLGRFSKLNVLIENAGCFSAANVIIRFLFNYVLEIIATWKYPQSLSHSAQLAVTEGILRQTGDVCCPENEM